MLEVTPITETRKVVTTEEVVTGLNVKMTIPQARALRRFLLQSSIRLTPAVSLVYAELRGGLNALGLGNSPTTTEES